MAINVPAIALARGEVAPDNREVLWEDTSNMNLPFYERVKAYDSNSTQWRMVTQFPLELLNELRKVDGDGSGLDANFLQGRTVNDIIQLAKDGSFTLPSGFIFIGDSLGNATARELSGDATLQNTGALILAASGVTAGTYDLATVTVDAKGRVTSASSYTITVDDIPELPQSKITGLVTDLGNRELLANKENSVIDTSTTKYPTVNLLKIGLDTKEPTITAGTTGQYYRGDKTFQTLDKTAVGLGNVDNTSDANKPISSATQTALDAKLSNIVEDTTPQLGGNLDLNGNDINGTGNVDVTGNVIADVVQLRGGTGTQGEMSWSTDEETVQLIMDGTTLHIGQDTFVHARNNTASIITKGTAVYATGTLGASGRITVAPMIADGTIAGRLFIGLAAEDIAIGTDGQVMTFGKIRQINTNAYTDGDVLWISPTVAGQLTTTEPTAPNLKIATAFVIHAANNGTLMVRAEQGTDLHSDQRVQVSGLANNDVLTWNNTNQRWQNAQPTSSNIYNNNGTVGSGRVATLTDTLSFSNGRVEFNTTTDGILLPRLTTSQMNAIASPVTNTILYNTDLNGLYRYDGSAWVALSEGYGIIGVKNSGGQSTFYADLQTAINATADIDTVYIYSDIQVTSQISIPNRTSLTIEMNGRRIWYNTTSGDFNLFRFTTSGGAGTDRIFTLNGGGTLEQVGTISSATNAAVIHFFHVGTQRQLQIFAGTTLIKAENAFSIFNQAYLRLIDGGIWYSTNGTISLNTAAAIIRNANIDIFTSTGQFSGAYDNCHLNTRSGAFWITGAIINSRVTGAILFSGSNIGMIMCSGNDVIVNNVIENGAGAVNWAINCYYAGSSGRISNNTINSTSGGVYLRFGSAFNNYIYSASSRAITKTSLGNGVVFGNTLITNATSSEALYTTGGAGIINNYCLCLNASNTAPAIRSDGANEQIIGNKAIVNNSGVANINLVGNVYLTGNVLGAIGTGVGGAGSNLMTNTTDAFGNIKIG